MTAADRGQGKRSGDRPGAARRPGGGPPRAGRRRGGGRSRRPSARWSRSAKIAVLAALAIFVALQAGASLASGVYLLDAVNHFRPWWVALSLLPLLLVCAWVPRAWPWLLAAAAAGVLVVVSPGLAARLGAPKPAPAAEPLTVVTFNILGGNPRRAQIQDWLLRTDPDVVAIQEANPAWDAAVDRSPLAAWDRVTAADRARNVELFSRLPLTAPRFLSAPGRRPVTLAVISHAGRPICVASIHPQTIRNRAQWLERNADLEYAAYWIGTHCPPAAEKIIMGDWNVAPWSGHFRRFLAANALRSADPGLWPAPTRLIDGRKGLGAPIDHVAISSGLAAQDCRLGPAVGSDHRPVSCDIVLARP
ncbi:endonuclease/exonuclease/phosphatase family protein [Phenylobacterium sp.]|uniref:endonuclease/exonuclease/phosphatase family protein n=1 Tax=Phenylobacterium sp. TaxID=1871053 RepID=UPI0035AD9125